MSKIYRWQATNAANPELPPASEPASPDLWHVVLGALAYGTWVAWVKQSDDDRWQPTVYECDGAGPTVGDWGWTPIPTDDPRIAEKFFDQPDADEIEREIITTLRFRIGMNDETAEEALTQVEQYDGYRVQSIATSDVGAPRDFEESEVGR